MCDRQESRPDPGSEAFASAQLDIAHSARKYLEAQNYKWIANKLKRSALAAPAYRRFIRTRVVWSLSQPNGRSTAKNIARL